MLARKLLMASRLRFALIGATKATGSTGNSITVTSPALGGGALLLAAMATVNNGDWTQGTGWTEDFDSIGNANNDPGFSIQHRATDGSATYNFVNTLSSGQAKAIQALAFSKALYDTIGAMAYRSGAGALAIPAITSAGGLIVCMVASDNSSATHSVPSDMALIDTATMAGIKLSMFIQSVAAGATGTRTSTITGSGNHSGIMIGVKEKP